MPTAKDAEPRFYCLHESPIGDLLLAGDERALTNLHFTDGPKAAEPAPDWKPATAPFDAVREQLDAYFAGKLQTFDLTLEPEGTPFQIQAWFALRLIPFGETRSYAQQATTLGKPTASRAVAAANGQNPIAILLPCHRVIGSDGSLTGFGGGLPIKQALLDHERKNAKTPNAQLNLF